MTLSGERLAEVWAELRGAEAIGFVAEIQPEVATLMLNEREEAAAALVKAREALGTAEYALMVSSDQNTAEALQAISEAVAALAASPVRATPEAPRCSGHCIGTASADTLVEDLTCPVHGVEAQKAAQLVYPNRQAWLDAVAVRATPEAGEGGNDEA